MVTSVTAISERKLYRVREVAEILGLGRSMIYQMASDGRIPSVRVGRALRIPAAAIENLAGTQDSRLLPPPREVA